MTVVVAVLVVVVVLVAVRRIAQRTGRGLEVDRFTAARDMTNRWSGDPTTTPQPLQDYLRGLKPPPSEDSSSQ